MQDSEENEKRKDFVEQIPVPSSSFDVTEPSGLAGCDLPLVVLSSLEQRVDTPSKNLRDDECSDDCESFIPANLMSFAWQIAKGMVWINYLYQNFGQILILTLAWTIKMLEKALRIP